MADQQRSEGVRTCVDKLGADHRECVHLVFYQGMALADVARIQQIPEGTVKTRLFHARQKLKQCLQRMLAREGEEPLGEPS
jgi:RNA polymerase sigma-70 factor (ECF subfamily)